MYLSQLSGKSCLHNVLLHSPYDLNASIKYMLAKDVAAGVLYLHKHGLLHGMLDTWNVLLDRNWTAKVGNWVQLVVAELEEEMCITLPDIQSSVAAVDDETCKRLVFR